MKNSYIKFITIVSLSLFVLKGHAQQDPQYTQYMYNMSVINPAYAINEPGQLNTGLIYRNQWAGMEGAPETINFFAHTPISNRLEAGISIVHDEIEDIVEENNLYLDVNYILPMSDKTKLSFGVKAGLTLFDANLSSLTTPEGGNDLALQNVNEVFPNFGFGTYFFSDNYYIGLSAPNVFTTKHLENESGISGLAEEEIHYFLTGGYVFDLNPNLKFKPAFMMRGVEGAPLSIDVTANLLINNRVEAGIGYRIGDAISGLVNFRITPDLRIGYAYDYTTSNLGNFNDGTHEILILFDIGLGAAPKYDKSPRFF